MTDEIPISSLDQTTSTKIPSQETTLSLINDTEINSLFPEMFIQDILNELSNSIQYHLLSSLHTPHPPLNQSFTLEQRATMASLRSEIFGQLTVINACDDDDDDDGQANLKLILLFVELIMKESLRNLQELLMVFPRRTADVLRQNNQVFELIDQLEIINDSDDFLSDDDEDDGLGEDQLFLDEDNNDQDDDDRHSFFDTEDDIKENAIIFSFLVLFKELLGRYPPFAFNDAIQKMPMLSSITFYNMGPLIKDLLFPPQYNNNGQDINNINNPSSSSCGDDDPITFLNLPQLTSLELQQCSLSSNDMKHLSSSLLPSLKLLSFQDTKIFDPGDKSSNHAAIEKGFNYLLSNLLTSTNTPNLSCLELNSTRLQPNTVSLYLTNSSILEGLEVLRLGDNPDLTSEALSTFFGSTFFSSSSSSSSSSSLQTTKLQTLDFSDLSSFNNTHITMLSSSKSLSNLQKLSISATDVDDKGIMALSQSPYITNLQSLSFGRSSKISSSSFKSIASSTSLSNLTCLSFPWCKNIDSDAFRFLAESTTLMNVVDFDSSGTDLSLPHETYEDNLKTFFNSRFVNNLPQMSFYTSKISYRGCLLFTQSTGFINLEQLNFSFCPLVQVHLTIKPLLFSPNFPKLKHLDLTATDITDDDLIEISRVDNHVLSSSPSRPRLTALIIGYNDAISDRGIDSICQSPHFAELNTFSVYGCPMITNDSMKSISQSTFLSNLLSLSVADTQVDEKGWDYFRAAKRSLQF